MKYNNIFSYRKGWNKPGIQRGVHPPLQNYLNTLAELDVFCYSEQKEIAFRRNHSQSEKTEQPTQSRIING